MEQTHETGGVSLVSANLAVDFNQTLLDDGSDFPGRQGIFQSVAEEHGERKGFSKFVGTRRRTRGLSKQMARSANFFVSRVRFDVHMFR
jgi:hypothetical protein